MKKFRFLTLLICFALILQCVAVPGLATEAGETTSETTEAADETVQDVIYNIPESLQGDASVTNGNVSIEGLRALNSDPSIVRTAQGVVLYEMTTGTVVYGKNMDAKMYPASLTKVMTCLLGLERGNLDEIITVTESAIADIDPDSTSANLVAGEEMSLRNLLYCLMVESANDAGAVIAEHLSGDMASFAELMNKRAKEIGCTGTHFSNPHGLHADDHYTTPRDMAKITLAALEHEEFKEIFATPYYVVPATNMSEERYLYSTNYLISNDPIDYYYDSRFTGGKTGYTTPAGRCLVSTAEAEGSDYKFLSVVLGAVENVDEDGVTILYYGNFEETLDLMDFGFGEFTTAEIFYNGQTVGQFSVAGGENSVSGAPGSNCSAILPANFKKADINFRTEIPQEGLTAPINAGDKIGILRVWYRDVCIAQTDLLSLSVSRKDTMSTIFDGGVITDEESDKITGSIRTGAKIFIFLVAIVLALSAGVAIYNAVIDAKRRKRRRNRRRSR